MQYSSFMAKKHCSTVKMLYTMEKRMRSCKVLKQLCWQKKKQKNCRNLVSGSF